MMTAMELEVLGIGNAFTASYYNTSFLIRSDRLFLIDGPQSLFRILKQREIPVAEINDVIVTHIHGDHSCGIETLFLWKRHAEGKRLRLHTSTSVWEELKTVFFGRSRKSFNSDLTEIVDNQFEDYVEFCELREDGATPIDSQVSLEIRHNWHPVSTLGLKVHAHGRSIGISGDNCYRPSLLRKLERKGSISATRYAKLAGDWLWQADLIYHEGERGRRTSHTHEDDLRELPDKIQRKIRLVHVPDDLDPESLPIAVQGERAIIDAAGDLTLVTPDD